MKQKASGTLSLVVGGKTISTLGSFEYTPAETCAITIQMSLSVLRLQEYRKLGKVFDFHMGNGTVRNCEIKSFGFEGMGKIKVIVEGEALASFADDMTKIIP